jgi:hypothetical protein
MVLIALIPVLAIVDGHLPRDFVALLVLTIFAVATAASNVAEKAQVLRVTRGLRFLTLLLAIWMLIQILPVPTGSLANSIWPAAADALHANLFGHISIDIGDTIAALVQYLLSVILIVTTIFVAIERRHAELLLNCLCAIVTFTVVELSVVELGLISSVFGEAGHSRDMLSGAATLGIILNLAACLRMMERIKNRLADNGGIVSFVWGTFFCIVGFVICLLAIGKLTPINTSIVVGFGVFTFCLIEAIRRCNLAIWVSISLCLTALSAAGMIVTWRYRSAAPTFLLLQFAERPADALAITGRMLSDARWTGSGAGTFSALWPIYRPVDGDVLGQAPTTAASFFIEGGIPAILISVAGSLMLFLLLFRGALRRRRDSHYPTAGAAALVVILCLSLCDASFVTISIALIGQVLIGIGLAQSVSQINKG